MNDLTRRQRAILFFCAAQVLARKPFPTLREIGKRFKFTCHGADHHMRALQAKGALVRDPGRHRGVALTPDAWRALGYEPREDGLAVSAGPARCHVCGAATFRAHPTYLCALLSREIAA